MVQNVLRIFITPWKNKQINPYQELKGSTYTSKPAKYLNSHLHYYNNVLDYLDFDHPLLYFKYVPCFCFSITLVLFAYWNMLLLSHQWVIILPIALQWANDKLLIKWLLWHLCSILKWYWVSICFCVSESIKSQSRCLLHSECKKECSKRRLIKWFWFLGF